MNVPENAPNAQSRLFKLIENSYKSDIPLADEVAKALFISSNSAYRRIRNDTALTLDECQKLAEYFGVSLDEAVKVTSEKNINFHFEKFDQSNFNAYLDFIDKEFGRRLSSDMHHTTLTAKDIPSFYFFLFPELLIFKAYYYARVMWNLKGFVDIPFDYHNISTVLEMLIVDLKPKGKKITESYVLFPTIEVWNEYTIDGHLQHIKYAWETGYFANKENALLIIQRTQDLIAHIKQQAVCGRKFLVNDAENKGATYDLYYSEGIQLENTILTTWEHAQNTYIIYNTGDYLITSDEHFCNRVRTYFENMKSRSGLVSRYSEKERNRLFSKMQQKIEALRAEIA